MRLRSLSGDKTDIAATYLARFHMQARRQHDAVVLFALKPESRRLGLYEAVLQVGWPQLSDEKKTEQQSQAAAAAWHIVSERKPNEDKRRMKPEVDLSAPLLDSLAGAPERYGRPVRLVRRVAGDYEFVHDQMHAYLAARWFSQEGFNVSELEKMVAASAIWAHAVTERGVL